MFAIAKSFRITVSVASVFFPSTHSTPRSHRKKEHLSNTTWMRWGKDLTAYFQNWRCQWEDVTGLNEYIQYCTIRIKGGENADHEIHALYDRDRRTGDLCSGKPRSIA